MQPVGAPLFHRILVGIDGSAEALHACRLANRLRASSGRLLAVSVAETFYAIHAGLDARGQSDPDRFAGLDPRHLVEAVVEESRDADLLTRETRNPSASNCGRRGAAEPSGWPDDPEPVV